MLSVTQPHEMNAHFALGFNRRSIEDLLSLYEPDAIAQGEVNGPIHRGVQAIRSMLEGLLSLPGTMRAVNNFCLQHGDVAILRADWNVSLDDGTVLASGSSAELIRKQVDGRWLYMIDHAVGATVPRAD